MFKGYNENLDIELKDGMKVILNGNISVYEREGQYQMYVKEIDIEGQGELYQKYEELKNKLSEEGLFNSDYKKSIPSYPNKIGIVTSSTGAALQDMLNVIKRRYPSLDIYLYSSLVQGDKAAEEMIKGLIALDSLELDTLILARGGGSIEDLFAFNDEELARVIFALKTPIITGIGHEIDFTIADFVGDLRAPTPSVAAELATPNSRVLREELGRVVEEIYLSLDEKLRASRQELNNIRKGLRYLNPRTKVSENYLDLDLTYNRLVKLKRLDNERQRLNILFEKMKSLDIESNLDKGYSILLEGNSLITRVSEINEDSIYNIKLKDGSIDFKFDIVTRR